MEKIKYFTILGERCSGTTFTKYAIEWNFKLEYYKSCEKHFFTPNSRDFQDERMDQTLVICVVRDPIDWIDSFYKRPHHVPSHNKPSINDFINNEFYSIYEMEGKRGQEIMEDRHLKTGERYKNIFELRKTKNDFLLNDLPRLVKRYIILRYEDLRDNYIETLDRIKDKFGLEPSNATYKQVIKYKGTYNTEYSKKPILLEQSIQDYILENIDKEQEEELITPFLI